MSGWARAPSAARPRLLLAIVALLACGCDARPKTSKDWGKLTDKDWERIADEWETPEEKEEYEYKPPQKKGIDMEQLKKAKGKKLEKLVEESQVSTGPTMMFVTVDYPDCCEKNKTEELGTKWASMLRANGMDISTYVIEDDQLLYSSQAGLLVRGWANPSGHSLHSKPPRSSWYVPISHPWQAERSEPGSKEM